MLSKIFILTLAASAALAHTKPAGHHPRSAASSRPIVDLGYGSFQGSSAGNLTYFLGMPFAAPPIGNLRFALPEPPLAFSGVRQATAYGSACLQQAMPALGIPGTNITIAPPAITNTSEDCLFINIIRPAGAAIGERLPILFWLFGGGFEEGDTSQNPGDSVVQRSIELGEPVIYVSANYRLNAFGFLGGREVKAAGVGNAGMRDQRLALEWIQRHIATFGGDPDKVTIWGEAAGAISVGLHIVANDGNAEGLFRGAFMESGSPSPLQDLTAGQPYYDALVAATGCQDAANTLACLRAAPLDTLAAAVNASPSLFGFQSLQLAWQPRVDGTFLARNPQDAIARGLYARVPFVTGDCDDEGTLFSLALLNITTDDEFTAYIQQNYLSGVNSSQLAAVDAAYPADPSQGSPFNTGTANALTPQYKRLAAFQGDFIFQAPRRFFLQAASRTQNAWAFLYQRGKATPALGTFHGTDLGEFYGTPAAPGLSPDYVGTDALVNFANTLDPNTPHNAQSLLAGVTWPQWGSSASAPPLLTFTDAAPGVEITPDTYRAAAMSLLTQVSRQIYG